MSQRYACLLVTTMVSVAGLSRIDCVRAQAATPASDDDKMGEIVVTAQRRSERLTDVPMSVTALSADALEKSGITNTSDLGRVTPSVTMPFYGAFLQPSIRGVSSTGANIGDNSNVALYVDGVYQPQQIASLIDLPDVQQIEVLKGPQGTLYGQNATGGAILVSSMAPSFTPTGQMSVSYGNYDDVRVRGFASGPLNDQIAGSLAVGYEDHEGFRTQVLTDERDRSLTSKVVRAKLLFQLSEDSSITLVGSYSSRVDASQYAGFPLNGNSVGYAVIPGAPYSSNPNKYDTNAGVFSSVDSHSGAALGEFHVAGGTFSTVTSYSVNTIRYLADVDYSPVDLAEDYALLKAHYFIQELNFASKQFGPVSFLTGVFYLNGGEVFNPNGFRETVPSLPPAPEQYLLDLPQYGRVDKEIMAIYGEATYRPLDDLALTAGGRYSTETQRAYNNLPSLTAISEFPGDPVTFSKFTPRVTARYSLDSTSNVYATWGKGFKSGIINANDFSQKPVNPEVITAYEVGYKTQALGPVTFNIAAFWYDYKDLQVVSYAPPVYIEQNAASARIKGVDLDGRWSVTHGLTISGGLAYLNAKYVSFTDAQVFVPTGFGGNAAVTANLSGQQLLRSPKETANLGANYDLDTDIGTFGAFASAYYNSGFGFEASNRVRQGTYTTVDSELSFSPTGVGKLKFALWGKNLTNKAYLSGVLVSQLADGVSYADPRTFGIRAEYRF